eukprot:14626185-Heterocapsa_arctica.AAC.1
MVNLAASRFMENSHTDITSFGKHKLFQILLAQIHKKKGRPDQAKTPKPFRGTNGDELVDGKCENAGARRRTGSPSTGSRGGIEIREEHRAHGAHRATEP